MTLLDGSLRHTASLLDPSDRRLLAEVHAATAEPFRDPVWVGGRLVPRSIARHIERLLLKLDKAERGVAPSSGIVGDQRREQVVG